MIIQTFRNLNILLVFSLKSDTMILQEIHSINKNQPIKGKHEAYEKLFRMLKNNDFTTGKLLDCLYHQKSRKLTGIDLLKGTSVNIPQQINFT